MDTLMPQFLDPYTDWVLGLSLATVVLARRSIRVRHLVVLTLVTTLALVGFFAFLLWGLVTLDGSQSATPWQVVLQLIAGIVVGCGSAVGYSLILHTLGLAPLQDR